MFENMSSEELETLFNKLEDEILSLKVDIEERDSIIEYYRDEAEMRAARRR